MNRLFSIKTLMMLPKKAEMKTSKLAMKKGRAEGIKIGADRGREKAEKQRRL
jgi:hypothetical protein